MLKVVLSDFFLKYIEIFAKRKMAQGTFLLKQAFENVRRRRGKSQYFDGSFG